MSTAIGSHSKGTMAESTGVAEVQLSLLRG